MSHPCCFFGDGVGLQGGDCDGGWKVGQGHLGGCAFYEAVYETDDVSHGHSGDGEVGCAWVFRMKGRPYGPPECLPLDGNIFWWLCSGGPSPFLLEGVVSSHEDLVPRVRAPPVGSVLWEE